MTRRDPSTLTAVATRKATCYRCKQPIRLGDEQVVAYDGVNAVTYHLDCPAYPDAGAAMRALNVQLQEAQ